MLMNQEDYSNKMIEHPSQSDSHRNLSSNPIMKIIREVKKLSMTLA